MQFSEEVDWKLGDFVVIGTILIGAGLAFVFTARRVDDAARRLALAAAFFVALLYIWAELAVGVIFGHRVLRAWGLLFGHNFAIQSSSGGKLVSEPTGSARARRGLRPPDRRLDWQGQRAPRRSAARHSWCRAVVLGRPGQCPVQRRRTRAQLPAVGRRAPRCLLHDGDSSGWASRWRAHRIASALGPVCSGDGGMAWRRHDAGTERRSRRRHVSPLAAAMRPAAGFRRLGLLEFW